MSEEIKDITLLPSQEAHVASLQNILETSPFALDFSSLGSGKTYTSSYIAICEQDRFKHIVVIAPVSVKTKWIQMTKDYGIPVSHALSYCELRSIKCKQPKHGLLYRRDYKVPMEMHTMTGNTRMIDVDKCAFTASDKYKTMVQEGVLLVVDEIQNVKNVTSQFLACQALIKTITTEFYANNTKSRILMLSGSPIDKVEQSVHMFRTLDIMKSDKLASFNFRTYQMDWEGMEDIYQYCTRNNPIALLNLNLLHREYHDPRMLRDIGMRKYCYDLFQEVIKPKISSAMLPPMLGLALNKRNGFYQILDPTENELLSASVNNLSRTIGFRDNQVHGMQGLQSLRAISLALLQIETAKIGTFIRIAREALENNPQQKVAICVNYSSTIRDIATELAEYHPLILNGSVSVKARGQVLQRFQAANTEYRLIIGNVAVCSTGIDLDDKDGRFPRMAFVSANYSTINLYQLSFRFLRADSKSPADIYFVYGAHATEHSMLKALGKKSEVMKQTTPEQALHGVVFPNDHERYDEPAFE